MTTFSGHNFIDNATVLLKTSDQTWLDIIILNESAFTAKSPAGAGRNQIIQFSFDDFSGDVGPLRFHYAPPSINTITA